LTVLLDAPADLHFVQLIQAGVIQKLKGVAHFVKEGKVVGCEFLDNCVT
jgi:hypothetical protein